MEIKKTEKASLENKRLIFAELGLIAALLVVFAGFESSTRAKEVALLQGNTKIEDPYDIVAIPLDTPPPAPEAPALPMLSDELEIVDDDVTVDLDFQSLDDTDIPVDIQAYRNQEVVEQEVEEEVLPFVAVEQKPSFQGGDANDFSRWVNARLQYPEIAKENGVDGTVYLQFTIGSDGRMQDVKVLRSPDESLAREAVRVVASSPKWEPGRQRDRAVKVSYTFPVVYRLR
ncbi:MAG: energy transducer TonB [Bacteroidales bacterium]|jgi:protein TonB|nr:energy transducer TonB [Bacteroidales bacterium]MBR0052274.1 energy transducer TonB [Bacteroidales bacterium]